MSENQYSGCPYEKILQERKGADGQTEYFMKIDEKGSSESKWISKDELEKYPESKALLSQYAHSKPDGPSGQYHDSKYKKIDRILKKEDDKYFVIWYGLPVEDGTWETNVGGEPLKLFNKRISFQMPFKQGDIDVPPPNEIISLDSYENLSLREITFLNEILTCHQTCNNIIIRDYLDFPCLPTCISFLKILQTQVQEIGPYLIISDHLTQLNKMLKNVSELLPIIYTGSADSRDRLKSLFFTNDNVTFDANLVITTPSILSADKTVLSTVFYRSAIILSQNITQVFKDLHDFHIREKIFIAPTDPSPVSSELHDLISLFQDGENNELSKSCISSAKTALTQIQPSFQKMQKHGISSFVVPPIQYINCPLSDIQKKVCNWVLSKHSKSLQMAAQNVLRLCSHPFTISGVEFLLKSPDFILSSTKFTVLQKIIESCQNNFQRLLIITQFNSNLDLIIDLLDTMEIEYINLSSEFEEEEDNTDKNIILYNPRYTKSTIPIDTLNCVVIFDGETSIWRSLILKHRNSRAPIFKVTSIYQLECQDCCEQELLNLCTSSTFNERQADELMKVAYVNAHSNFNENEDPDELLNNAKTEQTISSLVNIIQNIDSNTFWNNMNENDDFQMFEPQQPKINEKFEWNVHQRNQLFRGLFRIGYSRWDIIQQINGLFLPKSVIQKVSQILLRFLAVCNGNHGFQKAKELSGVTESLEADYEFMTKTVFGKENFQGILKKHCSNLLKRVESLFSLNSALEANVNSSDFQGYRLGGAAFTDWWSEEYDKALTYITWKFGLNCYDRTPGFLEDKLADMFNHLQEGVDEKMLIDRAIHLCDASKKSQMTDEKVIETVSQRSHKLSQQNQKIIITNILNFGIDEDEKGEKDYESFAKRCKIAKCSPEDIKSYVEDLLERCNNPDIGNDIPYNSAIRITQRVAAMTQLRKIFRKYPEQEQLITFFTEAPNWRNMRKKWTPECEITYFRSLLHSGFGSLNEIIQNEDISSTFEGASPPSFLTDPYSIIKRINKLYDYMEHPYSKKTSSFGAPRKSKRLDAPVKPISLQSLKGLGDNIKYPIAITQTSSIIDIGHIVYDRKGFSSARYIYPAGYKSLRLHTSMKDVTQRVPWISEIVDTGGPNPLFRVYMEEDPSVSYEGDTPSSPWVQILKAISAKKKEKKANAVSGPEAYLLASPITSYLIQKLPNAKLCPGYKWKPIEGEEE
ncbi:F/Y-rich N-terminus family protein [Histomonas meleagridis]|uniref:F/Y-rich N-terminus family protein n=1 Tax=Histomonas meleagridis TaxID=135588 RepID=UPI0035593A15|nr:F/Y-rich N-terminus family protein [Histomonas meleagridis]KAH0797883.1 F/Y-rich N-terminus family protein [Histomonas meleagridis]